MNMTVIEQRACEAITAMNRKIGEFLEPDWEKRRYEVAKDIYTRLLSHPDIDVREWASNNPIRTSTDCVRKAEALINELKRPIKY